MSKRPRKSVSQSHYDKKSTLLVACDKCGERTATLNPRALRQRTGPDGKIERQIVDRKSQILCTKCQIKLGFITPDAEE